MTCLAAVTLLYNRGFKASSLWSHVIQLAHFCPIPGYSGGTSAGAEAARSPVTVATASTGTVVGLFPTVPLELPVPQLSWRHWLLPWETLPPQTWDSGCSGGASAHGTVGTGATMARASAHDNTGPGSTLALTKVFAAAIGSPVRALATVMGLASAVLLGLELLPQEDLPHWKSLAAVSAGVHSTYI